MNTSYTARRHLVERAAEMLERDLVSARAEAATARLVEANRPSIAEVIPVSESGEARARLAEPVWPALRETRLPLPEAFPPIGPIARAGLLGEPLADLPAEPAAREGQAVTPGPLVGLATLRAAGLIKPPEGQGRSRALEEIAMVQHQVLRVMAEAPPAEAPRSQVILIGSALPREGRSFIALNLAVSMATSGARSVLLVDADGRASSLTRSFQLEERPGLCDMIAEPSRTGAEFAVPTVVDRLMVLPYGVRRTAEGETPPAATSAAAILRLAASLPNHIIVLDPPPCLSTSDCAALAGAAGQVVLVVDAQRTARDEVEAALDGLDACPVLQLLLNRAQLSTGSSFGAHYETTHAK